MSPQPTGFFWNLYKVIYLDLLFRPFFRWKPLESLEPEIIKKWLADFAIETEVNRALENNSKSQKKQPTIFVGNHSNWFDSLFLIGGAEVHDPAIVSVLVNQLAFPQWKENLIPVSNLSLLKAPFGLGTIKAWLGSKIENLSPDEARGLGRSLPSHAAKILTKQNMIMFPDGGMKKDSWYPGIGFIFLEVEARDLAGKVFYQPVRIEGVSELRLVIWGWLVRLGIVGFGTKLGLLKPLKIKLKIGKTLVISEILKSVNQKNLEKRERAELIAEYLYKNFTSFN